MPFTKDHYKTLGVSYDADNDAIRRAYRELALRYHPDRNQDDPHATERFKEIQEAYATLIDPVKRDTYHKQSPYPIIDPKRRSQPMTPQRLMELCERLKEHVAEIDIFRMDQQALFREIMDLLSDKNISILLQTNDEAINRRIVHDLLACCGPLDHGLADRVHARVAIVAGTDNELMLTIHGHNERKKWLWYWKRYNAIIIFLLTLLICIWIWAANR